MENIITIIQTEFFNISQLTRERWRTPSRLLKDKVLILSFVWIFCSEMLRSQQCQGRHGGLGLALVSPAPAGVHPEPVVSHQQQEGLVQSSGVKQLLW